jgi:acetyl-CoA C-acetyltransferase
MLDAIVQDGLWDRYNDFHMGATAELVVDKYGISRADQDEFAADSHRKAIAAQQSGSFDAEIVSVEIPQRKGEPLRFRVDEGPRGDTSVAALAKLRAVFKTGGTVTAGNASTINDGAAALVVMEAQKAKSLGLKPLARITGYATGGMAPEWVMMAPEVAVKKLCALLRMSVGDFDLVELNEAFASQAVALTRVLELNPDRLNVHGGAVALGHPIGCSGARILTTLLYAMQAKDAATGMAALCLGGGNAVALAVERL